MEIASIMDDSVFLFKKKTAYELRISDWSSDVCSSDLAAKVEIGFAVRKLARLNRVRVVDEEQEDVAIGRIERRRVAADVDIGIIVHVRPVEHAWNLPPGLPDAISGDLHHRSDEFVIEDPAIVGTGGSAQFGPSIVGLVEFDL